MKLLLVVAVILVFQTKISFLSIIGDQIQEQDDEYENDDSSNDMVESSKGIRVQQREGQYLETRLNDSFFKMQVCCV